MFKHDLLTGFKISLSDLLHEWKLSLCFIFAISGIITPLLLLFGLKYGLFSTLRERLVEDPKNREIIPLSVVRNENDLFHEISNRPDVSFFIPKTREIAGILYVVPSGILSKQSNIKTNLGELFRIDIVPTDVGDPILIENDTIVPGEGQCVLSRLAADKLGVNIGKKLRCYIDRMRSQKYETVSFSLNVVGILPDRGGSEEVIYVPFTLANAVEKFRQGYGVIRYGWKGDIPRAYLSFDGVILILENKLTTETQKILTIGTGLDKIEEYQHGYNDHIFGFSLPAKFFVYILYNLNTTIGLDTFYLIKNKLQLNKGIIFPYANNVEVSIKCENKISKKEIPLTLKGYWASKENLRIIGQEDLPAFLPEKINNNSKPLLKIVLPSKLKFCKNDTISELTITKKNKNLSFPVQIVGKKSGIQNALVPSEIIGILNSFLKLDSGEIFYDPNQKDFLIEKIDFVSFRMFARSIDDVESLRQFFKRQDIEVVTKAYEIERVKFVEKGMTKIFWLIALTGILGSIATLTASFVSSVERKTKNLGIMRLLGLPRWNLIQVPLTQGILIGTIGFILSVSIFFIFSLLINHFLNPQIASFPRLCFLELKHFFVCFFITIFIVLFASFIAAKDALKIDPSEALREE
jgi:putative ABC transport system permease protein